MADEKYYGMAAKEIAAGTYDPDIMAKAFALALGETAKTHAIYIGMRAERLASTAKAQHQVAARESSPVGRLPAKPLPKPEDFADPRAAAAVRAMLDALKVSGGGS
jgi:DNA-directed RNA polymerase subunit K/omega